MLRSGKKLENNENIGYHYGIGAVVSLSDKIKPRILLGGGVALGREHMFAIDFGATIGYNERLSSSVDVSKQYTKDIGKATISKLGFGAFISVGYLYQL